LVVIVAHRANGGGMTLAAEQVRIVTLEQLQRALGGKIEAGKLRCPSPGKSDNSESMIVWPANTPDGFTVHSHADVDWQQCKDYIKDKLCIPINLDLRRSNGHSKTYDKPEIEAIHIYTDENGERLFRVVRPKKNAIGKSKFTQQKWTGNSWAFDRADARLVPYKLPEITEAIANDRPIFFVEGEKDADNLWSRGVPATTLAGGADAKWLDDYTGIFTGATIYILPDNDEPGKKYARTIYDGVIKSAKSARVVTLPDLLPKGDVSDWLQSGGTAEQLYEIAAKAPEQPEWTAEDKDKEPQSDFRSLFLFDGEVSHSPPKEIIKGLFPAEGVAVTGGQSSAGKTFILMHRSVCLYSGAAYFGHDIVEKVGTVLIAAEGRPQLPNRLAATKKYYGITDKLPICWPKSIPNLMDLEEAKKFVAYLKEVDRFFRGDFGVRLGQIGVDTVAAVCSMKNEDDNAEATKVSNILRAIGEEVGALMNPLHHFGKNLESGLRGASAWKGSADVIEAVLADINPLSGKAENRELACTKARDGEQGPIGPFDLKWIELGLRDDGDPYGSMYIAPSDRESKFGSKEKKTPKGVRVAMAAIDEALDNFGQHIVPRPGMPRVKAVKVMDVEREFNKRYVTTEGDPKKAANAKRMAFRRGIDGLNINMYGAGECQNADWIWKLT
jgi:hypothetical protein